MIDISHLLVLGAVMFCISMAGIFINRKNVIILLMSIELMLLSVNLNFVAFSYHLGRSRRPGVRVLHSHGSGRGSRNRARHSGGRVSNTPDHQCCRAGHHEGLGVPQDMYSIYLWTVLAPLIGAIVAGFFGRVIGRAGAHWVTIIGVAIATILSFLAYKHVVVDGAPAFNGTVYVWGIVGDLRLEIGFLIDELSATMMLVVTFVSLMIHVYTIGYMSDDPGYQRFFSYISLFTFAMLMLVMANNFFQLFFGWEAVGVVSYLLIGFWYQRESAIFANLKAFLVNRVGDFGFILGIAAVLMYFDSLDYVTVFERAPSVLGTTIEVLPGSEWSVMTLVCILLFIGAMGKSAQFPLHVWLPDSMEGPTPISALIHAATMVTAGIFMVARMSPLFELSDTALTTVMWIGAITCMFMGLLGLVQNDIKRVIAYSTLSQLGYMVVALGVSAYAAGIFHLATHAFFKALLFLAAGSVIIGMHHEQDMRKMGGLWKYMPITWLTSLIGTLALVGFPGLLGILFQGRDNRRRPSFQPARCGNRLLDGSRQRSDYLLVFIPAFLPGLPREGANGRAHPRAIARVARRGHGAADGAGNTIGDHRMVLRRAGVVRRLFRIIHIRRTRARCARRDGRDISGNQQVFPGRLFSLAVLSRRWWFPD